MNDIRRLVSTPPVSHATSRQRESRKETQSRNIADHMPPSERGFQSIPSPDMLQSLIGRARDAMKQGVFWDRGSILNITI